jgi:hypothetical protein
MKPNKTGEHWSPILLKAKNKEWAHVLHFLLQEWRVEHRVELADALEKVSLLIPFKHEKDFDSLAKKQDPVSLSSLLAQVTSQTAPIAIARAKSLKGWPSDVRLERWVVAQFEKVTYRASSSKPFWTQVKSLCPILYDTVAQDRLRAVVNRYDERDYVERDLKVFAQKLLGAAHSPQNESPDALLSQNLAQLFALMPREEKSGLAALESAVLANAQVPHLRSIASDAMMEQNSVRGQLIALQLETQTKESAQKIDTLISENLEALIGALHQVVLKEGLVFKNGYLHEAIFSSVNLQHVHDCVGSAFLSTLQHLEIRHTRANWHDVLTKSQLTSLTSVKTNDWYLGAEIAQGIVRIPTLTTLSMWPANGVFLDNDRTYTLGDFSTLTGLTHMTFVIEDVGQLPFLLQQPIIARLSHFGMVLHRGFSAVEALTHFWSSVAKIPKVQLDVMGLPKKSYGATFSLNRQTQQLDVTMKVDNGPWRDRAFADVCTLLKHWNLSANIEIPRQMTDEQRAVLTSLQR